MHAVPSLTKILPSGTEGGKEFGRIAGLLLFNEAKRSGEEFNLFDDASGDFEGLDGFSRKTESSEVVGYQYKFFSSPFSDAHRHEITASLVSAIDGNDTLNLTKWVLVTPDDLKNSATRKGGGDVAWFEKLKTKYKDRLLVEHVGHSRLQDLFLQTHHLCLRYYPSLIVQGKELQKGIKELRAQYDKNMLQRYGKIEFVGMSVYKDEATRRIPLENIYIPLSVVFERQSEETEQTLRINPLGFLAAGSKTVVLGDPGSGKSTLFGFLALVGISKGLQKRCGFAPDGRLTIVVTLRRYADELKLNANLSILDFVRNVAEADFNLTGLTLGFYEYYLESGQAVVLFDGLDELPSQHYKNTVRRRVESFTSSFPGNTIVISSRLVGYEAEVRFDESYEHYRVAKLRLADIKKFIGDWYSVRVEDNVERDRNANDLIKVMTSRESDSIRELAKNPLLLTIVALVHRIDAVLPDQRVVLYQKCTETLLNTWYKAKRSDDDIVKGRIEQRNRVRVEAIAYWMHTRSAETAGRSVAKHSEMLKFLATHIVENEHLKDTDEAEDQAEEFLLFIKNSAGLMIEAGDGLYSFIHLTFQEYLCATHLLAFGETSGAQSIWEKLNGALQNPRWREVVRLLIASLKSTTAKSFYIDKLIDSEHSNSRDTSLLLNGLLRDSIEPAEARAEDIFFLTVKALEECSELQDIVDLQQSFESLIQKDINYSVSAVRAWEKRYNEAPPALHAILVLTRCILGLPLPNDVDVSVMSLSSVEELLFNNLIWGGNESIVPPEVLEKLAQFQSVWATRNAEANAASAICLGLSTLLDKSSRFDQIFARELSLLFTANYGPHHDHGLNLVSMAASVNELHPALELALHTALSKRAGQTKNSVQKLFAPTVREWLSRDENNSVSAPKFFRAFQHNVDARKPLGEGKESSRHNIRRLRGSVNEIRLDRKLGVREQKDLYWERLISSDIFAQYIPLALDLSFEIELSHHWREAIIHSLSQSLPTVFSEYFDPEEWNALAGRLNEDALFDGDAEFAAWLILFDIWVYLRKGYVTDDESPIATILERASELAEPKIKLAVALRKCFLGSHDAAAQFCDLLEGSPEVYALLRSIGWPTSEEVARAVVRRPSNRRAPSAIAETDI